MDDSDSGPRVSCVLPARNEAESLPDTVTRWDAALATCTRDYEIIVVDDGSTDDTAAVLRDLGIRYDHVKVLSHNGNVGYGAAIANGFAHAAFPLLFFTDADGQYESEDFPLLLEHIGAADLVIGYRLRRADPGFRDVLSRGYNLLVRRVLGVSWRDMNCAFKLMHRDAFRKLRIQATGFSVNAEMAANALRAELTVVEVGVRHRPRAAGRSTVRPFHILVALYGLVRLRTRRSRLPSPEPTWSGEKAIESGHASLHRETPASRRRSG